MAVGFAKLEGWEGPEEVMVRAGFSVEEGSERAEQMGKKKKAGAEQAEEKTIT